MFLSKLHMIFRKFDLSFEKLGQWRRKWADFSISLPQLQIALSESWKLCLNLCSRRWLKPNLNLVNNLLLLDYDNWKQYFQKDVWSSKVFSWRYSSFLNCEYLGPVCSIRLPQKEKRNLERNHALLWIEKYYYFLRFMYSQK